MCSHLFVFSRWLFFLPVRMLPAGAFWLWRFLRVSAGSLFGLPSSSRSARAGARSLLSWIVFVLIVFAFGQARAQTSGGPVTTILESAVWNKAAQVGASFPVPAAGTAMDTAFNNALATIGTADVAAAGGLAVGGAVSVGAMALMATMQASPIASDCVAATCDASGHVVAGVGPNAGSQVFAPDPSSPFGSFDLKMGMAQNWYCQNNDGSGMCGDVIYDVAQSIGSQAAQGQTQTGPCYDRSGALWVCPIKSTPQNGYMGEVDIICCYNVPLPGAGPGAPDVVAPGDVFNMPKVISGQSQVPPSAALAVPNSGVGPVSPFGIVPSGNVSTTGGSSGGTVGGGGGGGGFTSTAGTGQGVAWPPSTMQKPANPQILADLANQIATQIATDLGGGGSGQVGLPNTITASDIQQIELSLGRMINLNDLFAPVTTGTGQQVTVTSNGTPSTPLATGTSLTTGTSVQQFTGQNYPTQSTLSNASRCGNLLAGEQPCGVTIDAEWYQWMDQETAEIAACASATTLTLTASCAQTQLSLMTRTQVATQTATADKTDTLTSVQTAIQTATKTQDATLTATQDPVGTSSGFPIPPIVLPFNEWPSVVQQFNSLDIPSIQGVCPTVTFTSTTLGKTFTISGQCLVMEALRPYLAFVLPPTYLFMAFLLIMGA